MTLVSVSRRCLIVFLILAPRADGSNSHLKGGKKKLKGKGSSSAPSSAPSTLDSRRLLLKQKLGKGSSSAPSSAPSTLDSRRLLLCQYDACGNVLQDECILDDKKGKKDEEIEEVMSEHTVGDVNDALEDVGNVIIATRAGDNYELFKDVAKELSEQGNLLWLSSIALTVTPETGSENQISQSGIQDAIRDTFAKSNQLLAETRQFFAAFRSVERDLILDQIMIRVSSITSAYNMFIETRNDSVDKRTKENALNKFRAACNADNFVPAHMFSYVYGYACGDAVENGATCPKDRVGSLGVCLNGDKKDSYFTRSFLNPANNAAKDDLESFGKFGFFIVGALSNLMYAHSICVPPEGNACSGIPDADFAEVLLGMKSSLDEVVGNLKFVEDCVNNRPETTPKNKDLAICILSDEGFPVSEDLPEYKRGNPAYAQGVTVSYAEETATDVTKTLSALVDGGANVLGALEKAKGFVALLGGVGAGLSILTHFLGKSETDGTQDLIKQQFDITNEKIDMLSEQVSNGFSAITIDLGDSRLDEVMGQLSVVKRAYEDFIYSRGNITTSKVIKKKYADEFRNACNSKAYKPQDIFRLLHGYSCGHNTTRGCAETDAFGTGPCKYGNKQRLYLLDVFKEGDIREFRNFSSWLAKAMTEAVFLHTVCLDPDPNSCPTSIEDPVFKKTLNEMSAAFNETSDNLAAVESCSCPCRQVAITHLKTDSDGSDCYGGPVGLSITDNGKVEVTLTYDGIEVFNDELLESKWEPISTKAKPYYVPLDTAPNIALAFSETDGDCIGFVADVGSRTVLGSEWYERYNCAAYTKDFPSNEGDDQGSWIFRLKVEPSDQC